MNIFQGWIFFRGEYFSGVNLSKGWIFFMCEYFSCVNILHVWIFFTVEYFLGGEYFSGVNISQFKFRIRTDYFGLVEIAFRGLPILSLLRPMSTWQRPLEWKWPNFGQINLYSPLAGVLQQHTLNIVTIWALRIVHSAPEKRALCKKLYWSISATGESCQLQELWWLVSL